MKSEYRVVMMSLVAAVAIPVQAGRFAEYTQRYKNPPSPTKGVVMAGYLGSKGTEWLAGAAFLTDGTLIVAGTSLGPKLDKLAGTAVRVVGQDTPAPTADTVKLNAKGVLEISDPWKTPEATGFVAALSPDLKNCLWAVRFPWQSASITDVTADETGIYVVGVAGPKAAALGKIIDVSAEPSTGNGTTLVAKLAKDGSRVLWLASFTDAGKGPTVRLLKNGQIMTEGGWVYVFHTDGTLSKVAKVNKVDKRCRGVDPTTFGYAMGWDTNTRTGHEPWRQPHLAIAGPPDADGKSPSKEYYAWNPKLVGSQEGHRLVSDSSFRHLWYDDAGTLYAVGWSDGGNTVLEQDPMDLHKSLAANYGMQGLGFSTWGASVGSFCHLLKLKPEADKLTPLNKTLWASYLSGKDKPNSAFISQIKVATDGSVLIAGSSAHQLIQTGDAIHWNPDDCAGQYIAVLKDDFSSIRFSSIIEATGIMECRAKQPWSIATGKSNGRNLAVFVTSGTATHGQTDHKAPQRNPIQPEFGGGFSDGYIVVVDLGP